MTKSDNIGSVTLRDIAQRLNLSVTTVADALKDRPNARVAPGTRAFVRQEAARLGYRPNLFARRLVHGRANNLIGLVSARFSGNQTREEERSQLHRALLKTEYELAFVSAAHQERLAETVAAFIRLRPAALLWATEYQDPPAMEEELTRYIHAGGIVVSFDDERDVPCDASIFDEVEHTELAMRHLLELGHRFIGVGIDEWDFGVHPQGVFRALAAYGLDRETAIRVYENDVNPSYETGERIAERWLSEPNRPTAMCLWTDRQAGGFIHRVTRAGVKIPEEVSVIGHGNEHFGPYLPVALTSMTRFDPLLVETALELLNDRLEGRYSGPPRRRITHSKLILRASTAPVRS